MITFSKKKKKLPSHRAKWFPFAFNQVSAQSSRPDLKIVTVATILDFKPKDFSNSEFPSCPDASHQVSAQSDLRFGRRCGLKILQFLPQKCFLLTLSLVTIQAQPLKLQPA